MLSCRTLCAIRFSLMFTLILIVFIAMPATLPAQDAKEDPDIADVVDDGDVEDDAAVDGEKSAFNNPAQAQKAENLANQAALESDDEELAERVDALEAAEKELAALDPADPGYQEAVEAVEEAEKGVVDRLSELSGAYKEDITQMREEGYGWGVIAHELGVHPSALGLGNKFGHSKAERNMEKGRRGVGRKGEMATATERDVKSGWGKGHGVSGSGKGQGQGKGSAGSVGSSGKGKGKGNSGNSGRGGGNAGGNGKGGGNAGGNGQGGGNAGGNSQGGGNG